MASMSVVRVVLLQFLIVSVSTVIPGNARPCKTLFISSYSFSFKQPHHHHQNPYLYSSSSSSGFVTVFTEISHFNPRPTTTSNYEESFPSSTTTSAASEIFVFPSKSKSTDHHHHHQIQNDVVPLGLSTYDLSSLRDRTKDILSVVVALLFGVGCGALTAATMYLAWSLFSNRFYDYRFASFTDDDDDDDDDDFSPKKMGYIKIPAIDSVPKDKEVV